MQRDVVELDEGQRHGNDAGNVRRPQALEEVAGHREARAAADPFDEDVVHQPVNQRDVVALEIGVVAGELCVVAGAPDRVTGIRPEPNRLSIERIWWPLRPPFGLSPTEPCSHMPPSPSAGGIPLNMHFAAGVETERRQGRVLESDECDVDGTRAK